MTGTTWVEESGFLEGPVMITNTHSLGVERDAVIAWRVKHSRPGGAELWFLLPVVPETYDGYLNDVNGFHVHPGDVFHAIETAKSGPVEEGNVGGGTGMICYEFKGGTGTASRRTDAKFGGYTVGVLVQCNCGRREQLRIAGVLVGREIPGKKLFAKVSGLEQEDSGSIIIVIATDAPLIPTQLKRLARRASLGLARTGSISRNSSGDIFIAFSTANGGAANPVGLRHLEMVPNERMDPLFSATIEATEEAIVNALVAAKTMTGINNRTVQALPHEPLRQVLRKYHRLVEPPGRE